MGRLWVRDTLGRLGALRPESLPVALAGVRESSNLGTRGRAASFSAPRFSSHSLGSWRNWASRRGWRHTELDKRQRELVAYRDEDIEPQERLNVVLTLDAGLQAIMESELAAAMRQLSPISISSVMIRPRTGEILALANCPTYDPKPARRVSRRGVAQPRDRGQPRAGFHVQNRGGERRAQRAAGQPERHFQLRARPFLLRRVHLA